MSYQIYLARQLFAIQLNQTQIQQFKSHIEFRKKITVRNRQSSQGRGLVGFVEEKRRRVNLSTYIFSPRPALRIKT